MDAKTRIFGPGLPLTDNLAASLCLLASGLINPVFWAYALAKWLQQSALARWTAALVVAFAPCCWVVFHYQHMSARGGYWLWTFGMLFVLGSRFLARRTEPLAQQIE
jgi:hypothetical protein